jgi:hypothetical protein
MNDFNFAPQGWECPKCKRVYSPTTMMCLYCPPKTTSTTADLTTVLCGVPVGAGGYGVPNGTDPNYFSAKCLVYSPYPNSTSDICLACNQPKSAHITFK